MRKQPKHFRSDGNRRTRKHYLKSHPFVVPVVTLLVLFFITLTGLITLGGETIGASDSRVVRLYVDGQQQVVPTRAENVGDLLNRLGIEIKENDIVEPSLEAEIINDFEVNVYKARPVLVVDEGKKTVTVTAEPTPEAVAEAAGFKVYPEDKVENTPSDVPEPAEAIQNGLVAESVVIDRATPIHFNLYGKSYVVRTHASNVSQLLEEKNVKVLKQDTVQPKGSTAIKANMEVFVVRKGHKIVSVEENIEPPLEQIEDPGLPIGAVSVVKAGAPGLRNVTYEIELENGREVKRREIQSVIINQPTRRVLRVGVKQSRFSGSFQAALAALRGCESGGNYAINTGNGYYGAYQYNYGTWNKYGGYSYPHQAPSYIQDQKAWETYQARGWQPWPGCSSSLGLRDIYR